MTPEKTPSTVRAWLSSIAENGPSTRPVPLGVADFVETLRPDPTDIKPERGALAAIVATRTYQRARKILLAQTDQLSSPNVANITRVDTFRMKNHAIGKAFKEAMTNALIRDERLAKKLGPDDPVALVYKRLEDIVQPTLDMMSEKGKQNLKKKLGKPDLEITGVFLDVHGGVDALPDNMDTLAGRVIKYYKQQFGETPDVPTILRIMGNSYESYIEVLAKLHQADSKAVKYIEPEMKELGLESNELRDDAIHCSPIFFDALKAVRTGTRENRSRTITCVFMTPTSETQPFLDEPADFEDPLRDAFDLHMKLLAA